MPGTILMYIEDLGFMKKVFLLLYTLCLLGSCTSGGSNDQPEVVPLQNACEVIGLNPRIISGTACAETNSPVAKVLIVNQDNSQGLCTGTFLSANKVLTAAHCFLGKSVRFVFVELNGESSLASSVVVHPQAAIVLEGSVPKVANDVAIITLSANRAVNTLPILVSATIKRNDVFSIYGYGLDEAGNLQVLRSGQSKASSVNDQHITAKFENVGSNSCNGDSGGPALLTILKDGVAQSGIVGLVSSGSNPSCLSGDESVYAHVASSIMLDFIQDQVPELRLL
jgi:trypsin